MLVYPVNVVLHPATLPLIAKAADVTALGEDAQRIFSAECRAGDVYALCSESIRICGEEKGVRPVITE